MGAFLDAQTKCVEALSRAGYGGGRVVWDWDTAGWSASAPNTGRRWRCYAVGPETVAGFCGEGDTGEEALKDLVSKLEAISNAHR